MTRNIFIIHRDHIISLIEKLVYCWPDPIILGMTFCGRIRKEEFMKVIIDIMDRREYLEIMSIWNYLFRIN